MLHHLRERAERPQELDRAIRISTVHSSRRAVTAVVVLFLAWLPLQTPIALVLFQYGGVGADGARAILLAKDVVAAVLLIALVTLGRSNLTFRWYDWAAVAYVLVVVAYSVVPYLLGSGLPAAAVIASARQFLVPMELYAIGRAAVAAGAVPRSAVLAFIWISLAAAAVTVGSYVLLPARFWETTMDLVTFERVVQGLPNAKTLWDISVLGHYGVGDVALFARAVAPFTHPVGTGHYFVLPALLVAAVVFAYLGRLDWRRTAFIALAAALLAAAIIVPISRSAWIAAGIGLLAIGVLYRKAIPAMAIAGVIGIFLVVVPPFSYSIRSAMSGSDSSVAGHAEAIDRGVDAVGENPLGMGMGQADQFGDAYSQGSDDPQQSAAAIGENLYLALLVAVGPLGLLTFVLWLVGIIHTLRPGWKPPPDRWAETAVMVTLVVLAMTALTASSLMRFTTSASLWLVAGLLVGAALARRAGPRMQAGAYTAADD